MKLLAPHSSLPPAFLLLMGLFFAPRSAHAVTAKELCADPASRTNVMGRPYSKNFATLLDYFCNFADSPHSTDVQACETFVDERFVENPTIVLRGETSTDKSALRSYCGLHKNAFTRHVASVLSIKELGDWISMDMAQYAELNGCYGIDEVSLVMHFDKAGKVDHYQFIAPHEQLYNCLMEKQKAAAASKEKDL